MYRIFTLCLIISTFCGCSLVSPWRTVYAVVDGADQHMEIAIDDAVKMGGKEVGFVKGVRSLDSGRVLLELAIHKTIRIERPARVRVEERILGNSSVEVVSLADVAVAGDVRESDTLYGRNVSLKWVRDSVGLKRVMEGVKNVKRILDSVVMEDSSIEKSR